MPGALRLLSLLAGLLLVAPVMAQRLNGFDLADALIPAHDILPGGPPRDGIPAIDHPEFQSAASASFLKADDPVLGLVLDGDARAYPIRILNWHEVVNDRVGDRPVAITYCPLCGTGVAFVARVRGRALDFGVSGLLYQSDVLLYDRQTQSLWSQLLGQAISGPLKGERLATIPLTQTTWPDWRRAHPQTRVLAPPTRGPARPYGRDPYAGYADHPETYFPVAFRAAGPHPKEKVLGLSIAGQDKAWPFVELARAARAQASADGELVVADRVGDQAVQIRFNVAAGRATAHDAHGRQLPAVVAYWFAWSVFHPATALYRVP